MPIEIGIWRVDQTPKQIQLNTLNAESKLEEWIVADISLIAPDLLVIGQQVITPSGARIDILAMNSNGDLVVLELKRDKTPREVVAQILDYASWVRTLETQELVRIFKTFQEQRRIGQNESLDDAYRRCFSTSGLPEEYNGNHSLVIVATELDESTERIVTYLSEAYSVPINAVFFRFFKDEDREYFTRAWFLDPADPVSPEPSGRQIQWNSEFYASFGRRNWDCARKYNYISAGGGAWYSRTLDLLEPGARVWVNVPEHGYTGVAIVQDPKIQADEFMVQTGDNKVPITSLADCDPAIIREPGDPSLAEYLVRVEWVHSVPLEQAVKERGFFGSQHSVCKPRVPKWDFTLERLKSRWDIV
ncbi:MAG: endonuclease NucS [Betaproteobacteria bacterium]|nr:endonuclease NucS [Betaproteobacteria bacterium]